MVIVISINLTKIDKIFTGKPEGILYKVKNLKYDADNNMLYGTLEIKEAGERKFYIDFNKQKLKYSFVEKAPKQFNTCLMWFYVTHVMITNQSYATKEGKIYIKKYIELL